MQFVHIGSCIERALDEKNIHYRKMAEDFGVLRQQVEKWRKAEDMSLKKIDIFCDYFGYSREGFLSLGRKYEG
jgi:plasmid maintenance system antidote protein VapI